MNTTKLTPHAAVRRHRRAAYAVGSTVATVALGLGGLTACGSGANSGGNGGTLSIGALLPLTGDLAAYGPALEKSTQLGVQTLNDALKAAGSKLRVKLLSADTATQATEAISAARQLISKGATCLVGPASSAEAIAIGQSAAVQSHVPLVSESATSDDLTKLHSKFGGYVFRTAAADSLEGPAIATLVAQRIGGVAGKTLSIAGRSDSYGQSLTQSVKAAWLKMGGQAQGPVLYDPTSSNFDSEATKITSGNPAAFVIIDYPQTYATVGAALVRTGKFSAKKLVVSDGLALQSIPKTIPAAALDGASGVRPSANSNAEFNKIYAAAPGTQSQANYDAQAFDATVLCGLAAVKAKSTSGDKIRDQLRSVSGPNGAAVNLTTLKQGVQDLEGGKPINYEGVSGPVDWDANGDITASEYEVYQYTNGTLHVTSHVGVAK